MPRGEEPFITVNHHLDHHVELRASHEAIRQRFLYGDGRPEVLFTDNETNAQRLYQQENFNPNVKDAFHEHIVTQTDGVLSPDARGTKAGLNYLLDIPAGESRQVDLRLTPQAHDHPFANFNKFFSVRQREADKFYNPIHPENATEEERRVQRQAFPDKL